MSAARSQPPNVMCLASYFKGNDFMRECRREGARVILLTREKMLVEEWPRESIDRIVAVSDQAETEDYLHAAAEAARHGKPDSVVALEESDVITAARVREYLCVPGMSSTNARFFRDKLAMRFRAREAGIRQPEFVHLLSYQEVGEFLERVAPPWLVKPRANASAIGIHRLDVPEQVWRTIDLLDARDERRERAPSFILERYIPGDVYHVNSLVEDERVVFADASRYAQPPLDVSQRGGVAVSQSVARGTDEERALLETNARLLAGLGLSHGTSHAEFIKGEADGRLYFLEVGARVGGAYTAETLEAARGVNLWREWAKIEMARFTNPYKPPAARADYGGSAVSLARQEYPDTSSYDDPEIVRRIRKPHHVGLIVRSPELERVTFLLDQYARRFLNDFTAIAPQQERAE
jgi:biotin carboxylase